MSDITTIKILEIPYKSPLEITIDDQFIFDQNGETFRGDLLNILNDVSTNLTGTSDAKQLAESAGTELKNLNDWLNRADGFVYQYASMWTLTLSGSDMIVTIPACEILIPNSSTPVSVGGSSGTIAENGGLVLTKSGSTFIYSFVDDLTTITQGENKNKYVIVQNVAGVLLSRIPSITVSLYPNDITRNNVEIAVSASNIDLDFADKNEVFATKVSGGGIVVNENITITFSNTDNAEKAEAYLDVTGSAREVTIDSTVISTDSRFDGIDKITLPVGEFKLELSFDKVNKFLEISPAAELIEYIPLSWLMNTSTVVADPTSGKVLLNNADLSLVTKIALSDTSNQPMSIGSMLSDSEGSGILIQQKDDDSKYIVLLVDAVTDQTGWHEFDITEYDSGVIFDDGAELITTYVASVSTGGGHVLKKSIDGAAQSTLTQRDDFVIETSNGEDTLGDNGTQSVYTPTIKSMNDYDATGEAAGSLIQRNAGDDGFDSILAAPDDRVKTSLPEANILADGALAIPVYAANKLTALRVKNESGNSAGNIQIGTTALASDVVAAIAIPDGFDGLLTLLLDYFDSTTEQILYISSSAWGSGSITVYNSQMEV